MRTSQYPVAKCVAICSAMKNAQHFFSSSAMDCKFIAQMKQAYRLTRPLEHEPILLTPSSSFVSVITAVTCQNDSPAAKYCATKRNYFELLTLIAYQLAKLASVSSKESRVGTKLSRRWDQETPSMSSGWNIMLPMMTSTMPLSIRACNS